MLLCDDARLCALCKTILLRQIFTIQIDTTFDVVGHSKQKRDDQRYEEQIEVTALTKLMEISTNGKIH